MRAMDASMDRNDTSRNDTSTSAHEPREPRGIRLTLVDAKEWTSADTGIHYRRETWEITGGEVDPAWVRGPREAGWEPMSRFGLYVVDGEVDVRLASYGGSVWPTAWPEFFHGVGRPNSRSFVEITDAGLVLRAAALDGASSMYADAQVLP